MPRSSRSSRPPAAPSIRHLPTGIISSDGGLACTLAKGYSLDPDDWQADAVDCILAKRLDGRWAAATTKISIPRQNGKNAILEIVELYLMAVLGQKILHTAHEVKTARKAFRRIASFFENERQYPELAALVVEIRKTNGQEAIALSNGGSIEFIARSSGSGRGFTVDVLVCDEDQDLTDDELAALLPTISAAPSGNPQVILTGTPPDPDKPDAAKGEVARRVRADALAGRDPNLYCLDYGVPDGPMPDVTNLALAYQTNPALGGRLAEAEVRRELSLMDPRTYARERLGWWGDPATKDAGVINVGAWTKLRVEAPAPKLGGLVIDVAPNLQWSSIALATNGPEGRTLVLVHKEPGTGWVVDKAVGMFADLVIKEVALTVNAQVFAAGLAKAGVPTHALTNTEIGRGCTAFQEMVKRGTVAHVGQPELNVTIQNARTRFVGDTQHWDQRDRRMDVTALVAASTAAQRWALTNAKKRETPPPRALASHGSASPSHVSNLGF